MTTTSAAVLAIAGYLLLMFSSPVKKSLLNGWRCIRRYPAIWVTLGWLGCANALFHLVVQLTFQWRGVSELRWFRESTEGIGDAPVFWYMPPGGVAKSVAGAWIPALESIAGLFNNAVTTFPIAVIAAIGFLLNRHGHFGTLRAALRRRFGLWHWLMLGCVILCAVAVVAKAFLYLKPPGLPDDAWFRWAPVVVLAASLWEYLFGLAVQVYLILHAFAWVRGISFEPDALQDVSIRRFVSGTKWAAIVLAIGLVLIELPLVLKNFPAWQGLFPNDSAKVESRLTWARVAIALVLIIFSSMQAWLALHGETLSRALAAHWRFCRQHATALGWFILIAGVHFWAISFGRAVILEGTGHESALGVLWTVAWPWIAGPITGWLLASWVCLFKASDGR